VSIDAAFETSSEARIDPLKMDWVHLPPGATTISLWDSLHDGELLGIRSDLLQRSLTFQFHVAHLVDFHQLPVDLSFLFELANVKSARTTRWQKWPGGIVPLEGLPPEEQTKLMAEYQGKWREESDSWQSFENRVLVNRVGFQIYNAELAMGRDAIALRLNVDSDDQGFQMIAVAAEGMSIQRSDGQIVALDAFLKLGEDYWTAFANRRVGEL
jgi:hypothetical protein